VSGSWVTVEFNEKRGMYWLSWGNETFFCPTCRAWRMWETEDEALEWLKSSDYSHLIVKPKKGQLRLV
jgi:hypothetical protein